MTTANLILIHVHKREILPSLPGRCFLIHGSQQVNTILIPYSGPGINLGTWKVGEVSRSDRAPSQYMDQYSLSHGNGLAFLYFQTHIFHQHISIVLDDGEHLRKSKTHFVRKGQSLSFPNNKTFEIMKRVTFEQRCNTNLPWNKQTPKKGKE